MSKPVSFVVSGPEEVIATVQSALKSASPEARQKFVDELHKAGCDVDLSDLFVSLANPKCTDSATILAALRASGLSVDAEKQTIAQMNKAVSDEASKGPDQIAASIMRPILQLPTWAKVAAGAALVLIGVSAFTSSK